MLIPQSLKKGDTVGITAPSGKVNSGLVEKAKDVFESWGLNVIIGRTVYQQYYQFAGKHTDRLSELQDFLNHPKIKAIICARGGYGANYLVDKLDLSNFRKYPKWLVGFSDITVFHALFNHLEGITSIHGFMPVTIEKTGNQVSQQSLHDALFSEKADLELDKKSVLRNGMAEGVLVGGNLSILYSLLGTPYDFDPKGKVLFLEEVAEHHYHIDRMLRTLQLAGKFNGLAGLILGGFSRLSDEPADFGMTVEEMVLEKINDMDFPVMKNFPAGHIEPNYALFLGRKVMLEVTSNTSSLKYV